MTAVRRWHDGTGGYHPHQPWGVHVPMDFGACSSSQSGTLCGVPYTCEIGYVAATSATLVKP